MTIPPTRKVSMPLNHSLRSRRKRGGERGARTRGKNGGLGARDEGTPATKTPFFHFCGRQRPQDSDWLIFDSKSHRNDVL